MLVDRSHRTVFPRLASDYGDALKANNGDDYFELGADDAAYADPMLPPRARRSDYLGLRVAHASHPPSRPPADPHALVRLCAYVCMAPPSPDEARASARGAPSTTGKDDDALADEGRHDGRLRELRRAAGSRPTAVRRGAARRADAGRRGAC